jgi:hypothetical protein
MLKSSLEFLSEISGKNLENNKKTSLIIVYHLVPDIINFIDVLSKKFEISFIIPKPNSINSEIYNKIKDKYTFFKITKKDINSNYGLISKKVKNIENKIIIIDIG